MRTLESSSLNLLYLGIAADHLTQGSSLHLLHEPFQIVETDTPVGEEEPVTKHEVVELKSDEAGEGGTKERISVHWGLRDGGWVEVDVIYGPVDSLEPAPHVWTHLKRFLSEGGDRGEVANLPESVVVRDTVISSSLYVPGDQISAKVGMLLGRVVNKQMIS